MSPKAPSPELRTIIQRQRGRASSSHWGRAFLAYVLSIQDWSGTETGTGRKDRASGEILLGVNGAPEIFQLLFEVISVLLLVAIIAAIVISRRKSAEGGTDRRVEE